MTIANYGELKTAVQSWAARTDFPVTVYALATAEINRRLRVRAMLSEHTATVTAETSALPADFLQASHAYLDRDPRVVLTASDEYGKDAGYRASGTPTRYTVTDSVFRFMPVPDGSYNLVVRYYAKLADFSADADTNAVLTTYPEIYLWASLVQVYAWVRNREAESDARTRLESYIDAAMRADRQSRFAGPLAARARAVA